MSVILDNANSFQIDRYSNISSAISIGGYHRSERNGPTFYFITAGLPLMYEETFINVYNELMDIGDGVTQITSTLPHGHTIQRGSFAGTPVTTGTSGRRVFLNGFTAGQNNVVRKGDYVQFGAGTKVYQSITDVNSDASGVATITLNTDIVTTIADGTGLLGGDGLSFKLILEDKPAFNTVPGAGGVPLYSFSGPFQFREII